MNNLIIRLGCFLTGRNYAIIKNCSEASAKSVKKYLSAILIVSIIWGFIGFNFTIRYVHGDILTSTIVSAILVFIVIQVERQIILSIGKNRPAKIFRFLIGIVMAIIGSVIIDQMLFKEDIEKNKEKFIQDEVNKILPLKTKQLDNEIAELDSLLVIKENERIAFLNEIKNEPFIKSISKEIKTIPLKIVDRAGLMKDSLVRKVDITETNIPNPKIELIPKIENQIDNLRSQKSAKENSRLNIRQDLERELKSKTGFLDELIVLFSILWNHRIALIIWFVIFSFFLFIELFVLINKAFDEQDDYDEVVIQQREVLKARFKKLFENNISEIEIKLTPTVIQSVSSSEKKI